MLESLVAFAGAAVLIAMVPGPSTVVIMRASMRSGRRAGVVTALGNEAGVLAWGVAAAVGLSALLAASRLAYEGLRIAGAVVLVWFGVRALWQSRRGGRPTADTGDIVEVAGRVDGADAGRGAAGWRWFRLGLVTNFANPKAGVFAVSFLPQFVPEGWPVAAVLIGFSVLWALIDLVWYTAVVWTVAAARRALGRPAVRRRLDRLSGVVLVGLGVRLAAEAR
ncbi:LysE family translocator [Actinomadura madurae]|uniref:LysE family translocator n=1 Tax=Actinomadura madurae TaxID=1993 RepID=UPI002026C33C|nr:LysE family translocator [Actinomadura madurae]MCP9947753.1 LysE family translocator [Actinomadura madurae]MCP9964517.1 LysE family translocator [Actinomadura madurae]MCP9977000.1 LysE family translocator [Actinomadura madurae]MCQ0011497.1 LysE family translocator [Actinomadura madurae]MCQ0013191.1 LysE family translocator [Actinomadura madurae]